ncbi:protein regulator of cytokinesis 1-like [Oppia nitens]|uniref:protein regulator of cytokinesis 1-like n=1 Tax=Oppia nitens TaxID=1686743 RepID=UPI0023DA7DF8|nr:protein regulator of cytokinesis 1-like [Oppia nitens]
MDLLYGKHKENFGFGGQNTSERLRPLRLKCRQLMKTINLTNDTLLKMTSNANNNNTDDNQEDEYKHLKSYISILVKIGSKRFSQFKTLRNKISFLMKELERLPETNFEKEVTNEDMSRFILSVDNLVKVENLCEELEDTYEQNKLKRKRMDQKLYHLWDQLEVNAVYRQHFLIAAKGCRPSALMAIDKEINKFKSLMTNKTNKEKIEEMRQKLSNLYIKSYISDEQRSRFQTFMESEEYTYELCDYHELELQKYQQYYEDNRQTFETLYEWHQLVSRLSELQDRGRDIKRFHNRGGALLAEEREKSTIIKKIPIIENMVLKLNEQQVVKCRQQIKVYDIPVKNYFENHKRNAMEMNKLKK